MSRLIKLACLSLASLFLLALGASAASANGGVRINTAATTAVSTNSRLVVLTPNGQIPAQCANFTIRATITTSGAVTIPLGGVSWSGCTVAGINVTITQTAAWSGRIISLLSGTNATGVLLTVTLPNDAVRFQGAGNDFYIGNGSAAALAPISAPIGTLVTVNSINFTNTGLVVLNLRVTRVVSTNLGIAVGQAAGFTGLFTFSPGINGAAV